MILNTRSRYVDVGTSTIHYLTNKTEGKQTLLLIHGSGGNAGHWPEDIFDALPGIRVIAPDLPGHGNSGGTGRDSIEEYADFIEDFCMHLNLERVFAAGHSLGGAVVLTLAIRAPAWLAGLILLGTGGRLRVTDAILEGILADPKGTIDIISEYAWGPEGAAWMIDTYKTGMAGVSSDITHGDFSACNRFDVMERLGEITLPSLIISGTADRLTPEKYGAYLQKSIPGSVFRTIENGGHMMALEKPGCFVEIVRDFLSSR